MLSRVADSLYWFSRYLERAEDKLRLTGVYLDIFLDQSSLLGDQRYSHFLNLLQLDEAEYGDLSLDELIQSVVFDEDNENSIVYSVNQARENARQVREQLSTETWLQTNQLYLTMKRPSQALWKRQPQLFMQNIMRDLYLIGGIADSTMSHNEGWQFMRLGSYMERAVNLISILNTHYEVYAGDDSIVEDYLDWVALLRCCTAFEAYCHVYTADLQPSRIAEFLLLNPEFPHSLQFAISMIYQTLQQVAELTKSTRNHQLNRQAGRLQSLLKFSQIDEIMTEGLHPFLENVQQQCNQIHEGIYQVYISFPVVEELSI